MSTTLCSHYSVLLNARGRLKVKTMGVGTELCCASNAPLLVFPLPVNSPQSILSPVDSHNTCITTVDGSQNTVTVL